MMQSDIQKVRLSQLCEQCLMLILQLRAADEYGDPEALRKRIHQFLNKLNKNAEKAGFSKEQIESVQFILAAFIDETLLVSQWHYKDAWMSKTLGIELFNRMDAGEVFFERLEELRKNGARNIELLEVYALCLALGFKGKYAVSQPEVPKLLVDELLQELKLLQGASFSFLSPQGSRQDQFIEIVKKEVPAWLIAASAVTIGFLFYIIMFFLNQMREFNLS